VCVFASVNVYKFFLHVHACMHACVCMSICVCISFCSFIRSLIFHTNEKFFKHPILTPFSPQTSDRGPRFPKKAHSFARIRTTSMARRLRKRQPATPSGALRAWQGAAPAFVAVCQRRGGRICAGSKEAHYVVAGECFGVCVYICVCVYVLCVWIYSFCVW
jgi:hypothetical protein